MTTATEVVECGCGNPVVREVVDMASPFMRRLAAIPVMCDVCIDRADAEDREREVEADRVERERCRQERARVLPAALRGITFDTIGEIDDGNRRAIQLARRWAAGELKGLILVGPVGPGKTRIAAATAYEAMWRTRVLWASVPALLQRLLGAYNDDGRADALRAITGSASLVLDDIDKQKPTEWASSQLFTAIDTRLNENSGLLITANQEPREFCRAMGGAFEDSILSRLRGHCKLATVTGPDRRRQP